MIKSLEPWEKHLGAICKDINVWPEGVVHVGAHSGQEIPTYRTMDIERILLIEPIPKYADALRQHGDVEVLELAIGTNPGLSKLHLTSYDQGTSLLVPIQHKKVKEIEVKVVRLDELDISGTNILIVDAQGSELDVLKSAGDKLHQFDILIVETTDVKRYKNGCTTASVNSFLRKSFRPIAKFGHKTFTHIDSVWKRA